MPKCLRLWNFYMNLPFYSIISKDLKRSIPAGLGLSETQITPHGFDSTKEGVVEAGPFQGTINYLRMFLFLQICRC